MRKVITILVALTALFATLQAKTITETRMHIYQNGDNGEWWTPVGDVDSIKFTEHTYKDIMDSIENSYAVIFMQDNGKILQFLNLPYGSMPNYTAPEYEYGDCYITFKTWTPNISKVSSDIIYKAKYDTTIRKYDITFIDYKGDTICVDTFEYGKMPTCSKPIPIKENNKDYNYYLKETKIESVIGTASYQFKIDSTHHEYTIILKDEDNNILQKTQGSYCQIPKTSILYDSINSQWRTIASYIIDESLISKDTLIYTITLNSAIDPIEGTLSHPFAISDTSVVFFSKGNLQYSKGTGETHKTSDGIAEGIWRFAENQYDYIGEDNMKADSVYTGWKDLFAWGTSGWQGSHPNDSVKYVQFDTALCRNADWGIYNAISNGGNGTNQWKSLSIREWSYLLNHSNWTYAEIEGVNCLLITPSYFTAPDSLEIVYYSDSGNKFLEDNVIYGGMRDDFKFNKNIYTKEEFKRIEALGGVALPCAGNVPEKLVELNKYGNIWTSVHEHSGKYIGCFWFGPSMGLASVNDNNTRRSVRLVYEIKK